MNNIHRPEQRTAVLRLLYVAALAAVYLAGCSSEVRLSPEQLNLYGSANRANSFEYFGSFAVGTPVKDIVETTGDSTLPGAITAPLVLAGGDVCLGTIDGAVARLLEDVVVWKTPLAGRAIPAAALCGDAADNVYVVGNDGAVSSFGPDGKQRWRTAVFRSGPAIVYSDLLAVSDGVMAAASYGDIVKLSFDGKELWRRSSTLAPTRTFAADDEGNLYIALSHNEFGASDSLLVLTPQGRQIWALVFEGTRLIKTPVLTDNAVVVTGVRQSEADRVSVLHKIDRMGRIQWSREVKITPRGVSIARDGVIYVAGYRAGVGEPLSSVIAVNPQGRELWRMNYEFAIPAPVLISGEVLAFIGIKGTSTGMYYMMRDGTYMDVVSMGDLPVVHLQPAVNAHGLIVFASTESLGLVSMSSAGFGRVLPF